MCCFCFKENKSESPERAENHWKHVSHCSVGVFIFTHAPTSKGPQLLRGQIWLQIWRRRLRFAKTTKSHTAKGQPLALSGPEGFSIRRKPQLKVEIRFFFSECPLVFLWECICAISFIIQFSWWRTILYGSNQQGLVPLKPPWSRAAGPPGAHQQKHALFARHYGVWFTR